MSGGRVDGSSSVDVRPDEGFERWRDVISQAFVPLTAEPTTDTPFRGALRTTDHPAVQVTQVRASGQHVRRTRSLIAAADEDYLLASIQVRGRGRIEQDGRTAELGPGGLCFYDSTRPYTLHFDAAFEQLVLQVPRRPLLDAAGVDGSTGGATAVALGADGAGAVVAGFFSSLARVQATDPGCARQMSLHGPGLLASALRLAGGRRPVGEDAAGLDRERVLDHLRRHAADPGLDADTVARACHLSRRAMFRLFEGHAESWSATLRRLRIERAGELLLADPHRSVAAVAAASGFGGEAQLHRAFRAATGRTPGEWRASGRAGTQRQ